MGIIAASICLLIGFDALKFYWLQNLEETKLQASDEASEKLMKVESTSSLAVPRLSPISEVEDEEKHLLRDRNR